MAAAVAVVVVVGTVPVAGSGLSPWSIVREHRLLRGGRPLRRQLGSGRQQLPVYITENPRD